MVEVRIKEGKINLPVNQYRGYLFRPGKWLNILNKEDIEFFKNNSLFEIKGVKEKVKEIVKPKTEKKEEVEKIKYSKEELEQMSFFEVKEIGSIIGRKLGIKDKSKFTDRSKDKLIEEIMKIQEEKKDNIPKTKEKIK